MKINKSFFTEQLLYILIYIYIASSVFSYTQIGMNMKVIKSLMQVLIIFIMIFHIKFKNYKWTFSLFLILIFYPLIMLGLNYYSSYPSQIILYVMMSFTSLFFYICLTEFFYSNFDMFIGIWQNALFFSLMMLMIIYRGISLNIVYMLKAIITNDRYGNNLIIQRYGMGFNNVNQLALFSSILFICSLYFLISKKRKIFSIINLAFSFILMCNAESRAPFVAISVAIILIIVLKFKNKIIKKIILFFIILGLVLFAMFFSYYALHGNTFSKIYQELNSISSMRLYYTSEALSYCEFMGTNFFGVGSMSTSFITQNIFQGNITIDSSIGYYLFTLGIFGTIIIFLILLNFTFKILNSKALYLFIFYLTYAMFENSIFIPNSLLSCFGCVILFILMRRKIEKNEKTAINSIDTYI